VTRPRLDSGGRLHDVDPIDARGSFVTVFFWNRLLGAVGGRREKSTN
jgi:hypothetical protein